MRDGRCARSHEGARHRTSLPGSRAVALLLIAASAAFAQGPPAAVEGIATFRERLALPSQAVFEAVLYDVSRADARAEAVGRVRIPSPGNPPFRFTIAYDPARIDADRSYVVRARIFLGEELLFTTDTSYPVLTRGNGNGVSVLLRRVKRRPAKAPESSAARSSSGPPLEGTRWTAVELAGQPIAASQPYLVLEPGGRASGSDGCNRLFGTYERRDDAIAFGQMASTKMACPGTDDAARAFQDALRKAARWRIAGNGLDLLSSDGARLARLEARAAP